jgi:hypothetical protein
MHFDKNLGTNTVIGKTRGDEKIVTSNIATNNYVENRKHSNENKKFQGVA